jgi:hypothetical protein
MTEIKLLHQRIQLVFAIGLTLLSGTRVQAEFVNPALLRQRQTLNASGQLNEPIVFNAPSPPPNTGAPGQGVDSAGARGCLGNEPDQASKKSLTALVPIHSGSELVWGVAIAEHPTFWFYVPYKPPATGKFVLQDQQENMVYQTDVILPETPGVVSLSLPSTAPPLEQDKLYHWYFKIYCQPQEPPHFVDGWITRDSLNPTLTSQLEQATPQQLVALYAANGIWHEALTTAAELRRTDPKAPEWAALLQAVGLDAIATEPIIECCQME